MVSASSSGFSASPSGTFHYGNIVGAGTATTTPACVITATGGSGSYSYAWSFVSGDAATSISNPASASVSWSHTFGAIGIHDSYWSCIVTDTVTAATFAIAGIHAQLERI